MTTVYDAFQNSVATYGNRPFLHIPATACTAYHDGPIDFTYGEMAQKVEHLRVFYQRRGLTTGQRMGLVLENRPDFFMHWLALNALGVSIVPINPEFSPEEINYLVSHSEAAAVISLDERAAYIASAVKDLNCPVVNLSDLETLPQQPEAVTGEKTEQTECALMFTSGSTGKPKACMLSNEYFLEFGHWYRDIGGYCTLEPGKERLLTPLPLVHMNALACSTMGMMMNGGCIIQLDRFHPRTWWQSIAESNATIVHYLGVLPAILLQIPEGPYDRAHQVKFGFGAGVNPKHHAAFEERFGFPLIESWAMTESGSGGCITANVEPRHVGQSCFGKAPADVEARLVDDTGQDVPCGEVGELLVRRKGNNPRKGFFSGYYKNPAATEEIWEGGWLHTGDLARQDAEGAFYFVDRKKNIIRRSGENISAVEVESILQQQEPIGTVAVTAVPDDLRGDEVMAAIELAEGFEDSADLAQQIFETAMPLLAYYKLPGYIAFVDKLPKTPSEKLQRGEVKTLCRRLVEQGKTYDLRSLKKRPKTEGTGT
ncbi:AMP-binding protein [Luteithermobacter gelatinilyticus]|uniref:AMP-binding protein n=1 Tax=Luteithermobacter gelatinilyticus TaxID=2582913 RepID=UPI001AEF7C94|nr:AMP-binding protein [Luteithermobacter gelatinilyticus]